jgi:hypothetical protein
MSAVCEQGGQFCAPESLAMRPVPVRDVGHGRDRLSGQPPAADDLVSRHVAGSQSEERNQRSGTAAGSGSGQLQDRMGHAA